MQTLHFFTQGLLPNSQHKFFYPTLIVSMLLFVTASEMVAMLSRQEAFSPLWIQGHCLVEHMIL
jgi:hypothetical protein